MSESRETPLRSDHRLRWIPGAAIVLLAILYGRTLCHSVLPGDPAEFITAAVSLGVCHPTGYPLYVLLGKIATLIFFFWPAASVLNGMSAAFGVLALVFLAKSLQRLNVPPLVIAACVALLGTTPSLWRYSTIAEVYALHVLLLAIMVFLMISHTQAPSRTKLYGMLLLAGLSLGNHMTAVLLLPGLGLWLYSAQRTHRELNTLGVALGLVASFLAGASTILLLLLFDRENTYNYLTQFLLEHPDTELDTPWARLWWLSSGQQYHAAGVLSEIFSSRLLVNLKGVLVIVGGDNGLLAIMGTAGLVLACRKRKPDESGGPGNGPVVFFWVTVPAIALYLSTYQTFLQPIFFIHVHFIMAFGVARLLRSSTDAPRWQKHCRSFLMIGVACFCLYTAVSRYRQMDLSGVRIHEQRASAFLESIEPDAVVLCQWHNSTVLWSQQWLHNLRPGVLIANSGPEHWLRIASKFEDRPLYFESIPQGSSESDFKAVGEFYKLERAHANH